MNTIQIKTSKIFLVLSLLFFTLFSFKSVQANDIVIIEGDNDGTETIESDDNGNAVLHFGEDLENFLQWRADSNSFVFSNNVDFGGNEVIDFRIENLPSAPECSAEFSGKIYHNTTDSYSYICNASSWKVLDNDSSSSSPVLPYLYSVTPNFLSLNATEDLHITGENLQSITTFTVSSGLTLNSFEVLNSEEAVLHVTSGNANTMIQIAGLTNGEQWEGNSLPVKIASHLTSAEVLENFRENVSAIEEWIPNMYPFSLDRGLTNNYIQDGGSDMYDRGNYMNTNGKRKIYYTDGAIVSDEDAFGSGGEYFTDFQNNIFILSAKVGDGFSSFFMTGNLGADGRGTADSFSFSYKGYTAYIKRVYGAGNDPSINQIFLLESSVAGNHEISTNTNSESNKLLDIEDLASVENNMFYYFLFAGEHGKFITNDSMQNIVEFIVDNMLTNI